MWYYKPPNEQFWGIHINSLAPHFIGHCLWEETATGSWKPQEAALNVHNCD
jgi:hypothetical protein